MLIQRIYDENLAQASYLVGCQATGEALVIDANRDVEQYLRAAAREGLRVTHVTETHIHADFVSGSRELARRAGARLLLSDAGDASWKYLFATEAGATLLRDGSRFMVGNIRIEALHTPGHTPEHLAFLVTDTPATDRPMGMFTGDFVFVGDVGRPDLLERAARQVGTMEAAARTLYRSLQRLKSLPDYLQLWPGHGAGSACGKALGAVPSSTLGYEKVANWALAEMSEDAFVAEVLAGQPEPPRYFAEMKRVNREGPRLLDGLPRPPRVDGDTLAGALAAGATVIDARPADVYARGHIPGTLNIPFNRAFTTWAGALARYDRDIHLVVGDAASVERDEAVRALALIGLDRVCGVADADALAAWASRHGPLETMDQLTVDELARDGRSARMVVVDVRGAAEWEDGHLGGAVHVPLAHLPERAAELPRDRALVVHCQTGSRSAIAASLLRALGFTDVTTLAGGYAEWRARGHDVAGVP